MLLAAARARGLLRRLLLVEVERKKRLEVESEEEKKKTNDVAFRDRLIAPSSNSFVETVCTLFRALEMLGTSSSHLATGLIGLRETAEGAGTGGESLLIVVDVVVIGRRRLFFFVWGMGERRGIERFLSKLTVQVRR